MNRIPPPHEVASLVGKKVDEFRWRATERHIGMIQAIKGNLTILATDGNLGAFIDDAGKLFLGHVQLFSGKVRGTKK